MANLDPTLLSGFAGAGPLGTLLGLGATYYGQRQDEKAAKDALKQQRLAEVAAARQQSHQLALATAGQAATAAQEERAARSRTGRLLLYGGLAVGALVAIGLVFKR